MKQESKIQMPWATKFKTDRHDIKVKMEMKNKPKLKLAIFNAEVNGKKFTLETKSEPGQFDFKIVSDVNKMKNIKLLVKYEPTRVDDNPPV